MKKATLLCDTHDESETAQPDEDTGLSSERKKMVATVTLPIYTKNLGKGQCVMVERGLLITAAHCVNWLCDGRMVHGDFSLSVLKTRRGDVRVSVLAVEPVSDIAVLGSVDDQSGLDDVQAYEELFERITPIKVQRQTPKEREPFSVACRLRPS
jgi:hypothetical protein